MYLKMSSGKWRSFYLRPFVLKLPGVEDRNVSLFIYFQIILSELGPRFFFQVWIQQFLLLSYIGNS